MPLTNLMQLSPSGDIDRLTVARYDADRNLVGTVQHLDGEFVVPVDLAEGESLWAKAPDGPLFMLVQF